MSLASSPVKKDGARGELTTRARRADRVQWATTVGCFLVSAAATVVSAVMIGRPWFDGPPGDWYDGLENRFAIDVLIAGTIFAGLSLAEIIRRVRRGPQVGRHVRDDA